MSFAAPTAVSTTPVLFDALPGLSRFKVEMSWTDFVESPTLLAITIPGDATLLGETGPGKYLMVPFPPHSSITASELFLPSWMSLSANLLSTVPALSSTEKPVSSMSVLVEV